MESVDGSISMVTGNKSLLVNPFENRYLELAEQDAQMRASYASKKLSSGELAAETSTSY